MHSNLDCQDRLRARRARVRLVIKPFQLSRPQSVKQKPHQSGSPTAMILTCGITMQDGATENDVAASQVGDTHFICSNLGTIIVT